jgi:hypothetical protein
MIRNFFAWLGCLTFIVVVALGAWFFRDDIQGWLTQGDEIVMTEPSAELAIQADEKLQGILDGSTRGDVRLSELELQSYAQYRLGERLPVGVSNVAVDLQDSTVAMSAALDFTRLTVAGDQIEMVRRFMGDSATVNTELYPSIVTPGEGRIEVLSLQAGVIPLPAMAIGAILEGVGLAADGSTVLLILPDNVEAIQVRNEEILVQRSQ